MVNGNNNKSNNMIKDIFNKLLNLYGRQGWWPLTPKSKGSCRENIYEPIYGLTLNHDEQRFEIMVGTILTQNTSWKNVMKAITEMNKKNILHLEKILNIKQDVLAQSIRSAGYFNQKAKKLKNLAFFIKKNNISYLKTLPLAKCRELLLSVNGIGPETADSILVYALEKPSFIIDAYTKRFFEHMGIIKQNTTYDDVRNIFMNALDNNVKLFNEYHALLVEHGKNHYSKKPYGINDPVIKELRK